MTDWKPGDIANGHILGEDLVWRPVGESPPAPPVSPVIPASAPAHTAPAHTAKPGTAKPRKRWLLPTLVGLAALFVGVGIGASSAPDVKSTSGLTVKDLDGRESDLREQASELTSRASDLDEREAAVTAAETEAKANTIDGDGTYEVGVDIRSGTWKNPDRSDSCYWSINADANGSNIIQNANGGGPQTLTLKDGQFLELSNDCGTWKRLG